MKLQLIKATNRGDERGRLAVYDPLPFIPVRAFVIHDTSTGTSRGHHAHRTCAEALTAAHGSIDVLIDDGVNQTRYLLNHPSALLVVPPGHWIDLLSFSPQASLVVFADQPYDEADYVRNFAEFVALRAAA
jgi:UDP-2-acetamido-3-amino-2,3-dideoxy-glucuronate N-acetyltransferase